MPADLSGSIPHTLAARYLTGYHTPVFSDQWGLWKNDFNNPGTDSGHNPDQTLPNGEADIASVSMPVIGPYDSGDPDLCEYHILLAKAAGIEAFTLDWFGPHLGDAYPALEANARVLLQQAEKLDFKLCLSFNDHAFFPPMRPVIKNRPDAVSAAREALIYAQRHYFSSRAYLRLGGAPVLTTVNPGCVGTAWDSPFFTPEEWHELLAGLREPVCLIQNYHAGASEPDFSNWNSVYPAPAVLLDETGSIDAFWTQSRRALETKPYAFISGLVISGCDNRGSGASPVRVYSRGYGARYPATWEANLAQGARFIQIATWNDHLQGSGIEPVKELVLHKNAAVPGWGYRELIATREYAARFTGKNLWPLPSLFLPERLYRLRKSGAPALRADRIRLYLLENDLDGATLGLEQAGV
ncbi:MAG: hypothetical protein HGA76_02020 [Candidatus Firestonebacteria bacterium]|nr:hypothetical protein [Candidatus Firestonebacteria bacterium]